ncbi:MAG: cupin domain-containing protein [Planctomycetaceae bacterium]|jgi:mannose-6-phosphate isomerase-like protein (cupin superfamily)|nr:cupin domain-containing protein [Planctomycetaceae bacterium]
MKKSNRRQFLKSAGVVAAGISVATLSPTKLQADEKTNPNKVTQPTKTKMKHRIIDFTKIEGVPCPCGISRRGLIDEPEFPGTIHRTDIDQTAKPHYHKKLTEVYYVISCEPGAVMQLNEEQIPLHDDMAFYIPPLTVHRLIGKAKTCIMVLPKYDSNDEYFPSEQ